MALVTNFVGEQLGRLNDRRVGVHRLVTVDGTPAQGSRLAVPAPDDGRGRRGSRTPLPPPPPRGRGPRQDDRPGPAWPPGSSGRPMSARTQPANASSIGAKTIPTDGVRRTAT